MRSQKKNTPGEIQGRKPKDNTKGNNQKENTKGEYKRRTPIEKLKV